MSGFGHWLSQVTRQAGIEPTRVELPERMRRRVEEMQRRLSVPEDPGTFLALANIGHSIALALEHGNGTTIRGAMIEID